MANTKEFDIIVCGQVTIDDLMIMDRPTEYGKMGGDSIYMLSGVRMWQKDRIGLINRIGYDFDKEALQKITGDGVDLSGMRRIDSVPSIHLMEIYDRKGCRYRLLQKWGGQNDNMAPSSWEDFPEKYRGNAKVIAVAPIPFPWGKTFLEELQPGEDTVVLSDPQFDAVVGENRQYWAELLKKITIWAPSEEEFTDYFDIGVQENLNDYVPYMKLITQMGPEICLLKLGPRGAMSYEKKTGEVLILPTYAGAKIEDPTGCGDSFCGGFLCGYMKNRSVREGLLHGMVSASLCIERRSSFENFEVTEQEAEERLRRYREQLGDL